MRNLKVGIIQIALFGIACAIIVLTIKDERPGIALLITIASGTIILFAAVARLENVIDFIREYSEKTGIDSTYITALLKVTGIAYITEFGAEICRDGGQASMASKIELAGKILIIVTIIPVAASIFELIEKLIA